MSDTKEVEGRSSDRPSTSQQWIPRTIPVENVQRAFKDSRLSGNKAAVAAGLTRTMKNRHGAHLGRRTVGDTARLKRMLGLMQIAEMKKGGKVYPAHFTQRIRIVNAENLIKSWGLDPVDYDL